MNFTEAQHAAIERDGVDLVVVAGAGSGKTRVLVERYIRLLERFPPDRLLAITFTDKAAREMRDRVRDALEQRAQADPLRWEQRRAEIEAARIGTIHSFCGALLRAHPAETGLDPRFTMLDEVQAVALLRASVEAALAEVVARQDGPDAPGAACLNEFGLVELRELLADLLRGGAEIRAALAALPDDTETLLAQWRAASAEGRRTALAELLADPAWVAALDTFWGLVPPPGDGLGDQCLALAPLLRALADQGAAFNDYDELSQLAGLRLNQGAAKAWGGKEAIGAARDCLRALRERYKARAAALAAAWDEELERRAAQATIDLGRLYRLAAAQYTARKDDLNGLDFDDLELRALRLLVDHPAVRASWQDELAAVLVDEFQDTSPEQRDLVYALAGYASGIPGTGRLFIVADGKQSIYRFRGADVSVFAAVRADIGASGGHEIALDISFRAHARLVGLVNYLFERMLRRPHEPRPYEIMFEPLRHRRPPAPHTTAAELHIIPRPERNHPALASAEDARTYEALLLAERIRELVEQGTPLVWEDRRWRAVRYGDIALLFQASTVFGIYEDTLRAAGVPFLTTAGHGYYGRKEVRDLIHLLRFLEDPRDDFALAGVLRSPLFALDDASLIALRLTDQPSLWVALVAGDVTDPAADFARETLAGLLALRGRVAVVDLLRAALRATGYMATVSGLRDGERRRVNVEKLLAAARRAGLAELSVFVAYLEDALRQEAREGEAPLEGGDAVRLMTVHRSKGLEFPVVVLPDLGREPPPQRGIWLGRRAYGLALKLRDGAEWVQPTAYRLALAAEARMERAERERLAYVALTRAQDYLIMAGAARQQSGDDWLSWLLAALDWPWEAGGAPAGLQPAADGTLDLLVKRHDPPLARPDLDTIGQAVWETL